MAKEKEVKDNKDKKQESGFRKLLTTLKTNKKAQIITAIIAVLILAAIVLAIVFINRDNESVNTNNANKKSEDTTEAYRVLDGVKTTSDKANLFPTAIVVENYRDVRPQNGLKDAGVVYEALAEGGITRFLAIYASEEDINIIGPVRSARHYFVDIAEEYGGIFAHIGGSPQALGILSFEEYLTDLNQFTYSQYYWRDENIAAPHNLFTSSEKMAFAIRDLISEEEVEGDYEGWKFVNKKKDIEAEDGSRVIIDYSLDDYKVEWKYNKEDNNYTRWNGGEEQTDANSEDKITAKNIIVQHCETGLLEGETERLDIKTQGTGNAKIFKDGEYIEGTWKKENRGDRTKYYDTNNQEIEFNRGNSWVEIVKEDTQVEFTNESGESLF